VGRRKKKKFKKMTFQFPEEKDEQDEKKKCGLCIFNKNVSLLKKGDVHKIEFVLDMQKEILRACLSGIPIIPATRLSKYFKKHFSSKTFLIKNLIGITIPYISPDDCCNHVLNHSRNIVASVFSQCFKIKKVIDFCTKEENMFEAIRVPKQPKENGGENDDGDRINDDDDDNDEEEEGEGEIKKIINEKTQNNLTRALINQKTNFSVLTNILKDTDF
jgi:hypothetical protein